MKEENNNALSGDYHSIIVKVSHPPSHSLNLVGGAERRRGNIDQWWPLSPQQSAVMITTITLWLPPVLGGRDHSDRILPPVMISACQCLPIKILTSNSRLESMTGREWANGCGVRWVSTCVMSGSYLSLGAPRPMTSQTPVRPPTNHSFSPSVWRSKYDITQ